MLAAAALLIALATPPLDLAVAHPAGALDPLDLFRIERSVNEPIRIASVTFDRKTTGRKAPDVVVELENQSHEPVWFVAVALLPPECPRWEHPLGSYAWYGRILGKVGVEQVPAIEPGRRARIVIGGAKLRGTLEYARRSGCRKDARIEMLVDKVAFSVTSGWEAFVDPSVSDAWNGRTWQPDPSFDPP